MRYTRIILFLICLSLTGCELSQLDIKRRNEYLLRAQVYYRNQKYMNALSQINFALDIDSDYKNALISKGWTLYYLKKYEESQEIFEKVLEVDDTDPWLHYGLGSLYYKFATLANAKVDKTRKLLLKSKYIKDRKAFEKDLKRYIKEKSMWIEKSLKHLKKSSDIDSKNITLYKLIAVVYESKGIKFYKTAIDFGDKYLKYLDKNLKVIKEYKVKNEEERLVPGLKKKKHEVLDRIIQDLEKQIDNNRKQYRIVQSLIAEWYYELAGIEYKKIEDLDKDSKKIKTCQQKLDQYTYEATKRIKLILKSAPHLANYYRNLAEIAKLKKKYKLATNYLKKYIKNYPLADPKTRVEVKMELKELQSKKN